MSNVVLISPPEKQNLMEAGDRPNMGLLYLAASLRRAGHRPLISDLNHDSYHDLNNKMKVADIAGMSTFTPYHQWNTNFAKHLKQNFPNVRLVAGGPHATTATKSLLPYFDSVVKGEGERAIVEIANGLEDKIVDMGYEPDMDKLPIPLTELELGKYGMNQEGHNTITLGTSRSCNYNCIFCTKDILGQKQRFHSVERVIEEVKLAKKMGFDSMYFLDDNFTSDIDRAIKIANEIKPLGITYRVMSRSDKMTPELAYALKESGARSVSFGLEHLDDAVLKAMNKGITVEKHLEGIRNAHNAGLKTRGSFIVNLPGATKDTVYRTLDLAKQEKLEFADWYALTAYPDSPLWNNPEKYGCTIDKGFGYSQLSTVSNVDNGNFDRAELPNFIEDVRKNWSSFKGLKCAWEAERYE